MSKEEENKQFAHYARLADLFAYPDGGFAARVADIRAYLSGVSGAAAVELAPFESFVAEASLVDMEEVYTRSFDVQALTTLDVGYVMFGDDYKRGELLVKLSGEHREAGVDCGSELSDHLPNILKLLSAIDKPELREELVQEIIAPALRKIIGEFEPGNVDKKSAVYEKHHRTLIERSEHYGVIYVHVLRALQIVLMEDFEVAARQPAPVPHQSKFLKSIGTEMSIENNKGNCHGAS